MVSSQPQLTASVHIRWSVEVSRLIRAGGGPGGAPGQLVLADLVGGQRGGPRGATEEGGEMGGLAASGALGSELTDLIVLEVGVADISQGRSLGAERARERRRRACVSGGGGRFGFVRGHGLGPSLSGSRQADGVRPHSLWWTRQARGMCGGDGTAMEPVAYVHRRRPQVDPLVTHRHRFGEHRSNISGAGTRTVEALACTSARSRTALTRSATSQWGVMIEASRS